MGLKMTEKTIKRCPNCGSRDLKQEFLPRSPMLHTKIGGEHHSWSATTSGSSCNSCGTILKFDKAGECPICKGAGVEIHRSYIGFKETSQRSTPCSRCHGNKVI